MRARGETAGRALVREISAELDRPLTSDGGEEVIFATVLDGVRYTLSRRAVEESAPAVGLSAREHEIARMVAKGYTNKTIAKVLDISSWTVDTHLRRIFNKLDVRSRSAMVTRLSREGALDERDTPDWSEAWQARVGSSRGSLGG